jgi:uncharacterized protein (DUF427 family)
MKTKEQEGRMAVSVRELLATKFDTLRYEPTAKRLRASLNGVTVADTCQGLLVWEPRRVVPTYAVPLQDISATLRPSTPAHDQPHQPILDPRIPFTAHTTPGEPYDVVANGTTSPAAAFRPDDTDLPNYVILNFDAFDWLEEDEPVVAHPHDPFKRIDALRSSRHVRIERDGQLLAESSRPVLLFETLLPVRFYLPADDVVLQFEPSDTVTYCAYKGRASYFSLHDGPSDIAWTYLEPLHDAEPVRGYMAFFNERVDVTVDGTRWERPITPWSA